MRVCTFAEVVLLLSPVMYWAVLINTNGWYGYEELKSGWYMRYLHVTNFERRLRTLRALAEPLFTAQLAAKLAPGFLASVSSHSIGFIFIVGRPRTHVISSGLDFGSRVYHVAC